MINEKIVTYLKGEEKFNDDDFIFEWTKYSSLIKADKDPGQYLPHLFIIYYFGPNETIQDAVKKLIDVITPKEILQFQENFIKIIKRLDGDIVCLEELYKEWGADSDELRTDFETYSNNPMDSIAAGKFVEDGNIYSTKLKEDIKRERLLIEDTYSWSEAFLQSLLLPAWLMLPFSISKIILKETYLVHFYVRQFIWRAPNKEKPYDNFVKNNSFLLNFCLIDSAYEMDSESAVLESYNEDILYLVSKTQLPNAIIFFDNLIENEGYMQCECFWDLHDHISELLDEFDNNLTHNLRFKTSWLESPVILDKELLLEQIKNHCTEHTFFLKKDSESTKDKDIVIALVKKNIRELNNACEELRGDKEVVMTALKFYEYQYITARDGHRSKFWENISENLRNDKEVFMAAFILLDEYDSFNHLKDAPIKFQNDKEIFMVALKKDREALQYASKELQMDEELIALSNP